MKKLILLLAIYLLLVTPALALAASPGISPNHTELEVPGNGSATANFQVHYFNGDLQMSLVDTPLKVEPETIHIEQSSDLVDIQTTIQSSTTPGILGFEWYIYALIGLIIAVVAVVVIIVISRGRGY